MADGFLRWRRIVGVFAFLSAAAIGLAPPARADLTVENLTGSSIGGPGPFYQDVADAIKMFALKEYKKAYDHLENAKKTTPRLPPAEVMMAQLYLDANQLAQAVGSLEAAIQKTPQDPEAYVMLAERATAEGRFTEATVVFDGASRIVDTFSENPKRKQNLQSRVYTGWAQADEGRGDLKSARTKLEQLVKLEPGNANAHAALGRVLFRLKEGQKAYAEFKLAAEADKNMLPAELALAGLFADKVKAEEWLNKAVENSGGDLRTQIGAAEYFLKNNQIDKARTHAAEAIKIDPENMQANLAAGVMARVGQDFPTAVKYLTIAHVKAPINPSIINHLALSLLEMPDDESHQLALQYAELNARQPGATPEHIGTLGWINYRLKHYAEAQRAFAAVVNQPMLTGDMAYYMASIAKDSGKPAEAVKFLKEALNHDQPFAYRPAAKELLAELSKAAEKTPNSKSKAPAGTKSSESAAAGGAK